MKTLVNFEITCAILVETREKSKVLWTIFMFLVFLGIDLDKYFILPSQKDSSH